MLKHTMKKVLLTALSCMMLLALALPVQASGAPTPFPGGMLTAPPPASDLFGHYESTTIRQNGGIFPLGVLNPSDIYLNRGSTEISKASSSQILMNGKTTAYTNVQVIGVKMTLQRWTGTYWTSVHVSSEYSIPDFNLISANATASASTGYYYRVVGTHWINHNGVTEQGTSYGDSWAFN